MSPQPAPTPDAPVAPFRRKPPLILWIALVLLAGAAAGAYAWRSRVLPIHAVTVRPFASGGGPPWVAGAITEEIGDFLRPVTQAAAEPEFSAVLEGTAARWGDRIRVTAILSRGDGHRYWTRTFDRPANEISLDIAGAIVPQARRKTSRHKPPVPAYELYLEGRQFLPNNLVKSIDCLARATQADPNFALAWAWLSIATESLVERGGVRPNEVLPGARDAAERAATLDPNLAETHLALGIIRLQYDWDWDDARREFERALELSPTFPLAVQWRDRWLEAMNRAPVPAVELAGVPRDPNGARLYLSAADDLRAQSYVTPAAFALAAVNANDSASLFHWLDVAYEERCGFLPYLLRNPALPRSDPRLQDLMRRLKLPTNP